MTSSHFATPTKGGVVPNGEGVSPSRSTGFLTTLWAGSEPSPLPNPTAFVGVHLPHVNVKANHRGNANDDDAQRCVARAPRGGPDVASGDPRACHRGRWRPQAPDHQAKGACVPAATKQQHAMPTMTRACAISCEKQCSFFLLIHMGGRVHWYRTSNTSRSTDGTRRPRASRTRARTRSTLTSTRLLLSRLCALCRVTNFDSTD